MAGKKKIKRSGSGALLPGTAPLNPEGKNGDRHAGLAPWKTRVKQLMDKYKTVEALLNADKDGTLNLEHPIDGMILKNVIDAFNAEDSRLQREAFFDRLEGKPKEFKQMRIISGTGDLSEEELLALAGEE